MVRFTKTCKICFQNLLSLCRVDVIMTSSKLPFLLYPRWKADNIPHNNCNKFKRCA